MTRPGFQIEYEIKESPGLGNGIFTKQLIRKGDLIWKYERGVNVSSYKNYEETKARLEQLSPEEQQFFMSHVYMFDGMLNEILDEANMWNHSESPNTGYCSLEDSRDMDWQSSYAIRDIAAGEELLDDYGIYEYPDWFVQLAKEYEVPQDFITIKPSRKPGFHVDYEVRESPGMGMGLFAKCFIPKDSLIWQYSPGLNVRRFTGGEDEVRSFLSGKPLEEQYEWMSHVYLDDGVINEILDDAKMWNHSESPNTASGVDGDWLSTYALVDIQAGQELLDDYGFYEYPEWFVKLAQEYNVPLDFVTVKERPNRG